MPFDRPDIPFEPSRTLDVDARHWRYYTQHGPTSWRPPWQHCSAWLQKVAQRLHLFGRSGAGGISGGPKQGWDEEAGAAAADAGKHRRVGSGGSGSQVGSGSGVSGGASGGGSQAGLAAEAAEEGSAGSAPSEMEAWQAEKTHRHRSLLGLPMISPGDPRPAVLAILSDVLCITCAAAGAHTLVGGALHCSAGSVHAHAQQLTTVHMLLPGCRRPAAAAARLGGPAPLAIHASLLLYCT